MSLQVLSIALNDLGEEVRRLAVRRSIAIRGEDVLTSLRAAGDSAGGCAAKAVMDYQIITASRNRFSSALDDDQWEVVKEAIVSLESA